MPQAQAVLELSGKDNNTHKKRTIMAVLTHVMLLRKGAMCLGKCCAHNKQTSSHVLASGQDTSVAFRVNCK